jgi:hypothetical protein
VRLPGFTLAFLLCAVVAAVVAGCGSRASLDEGPVYGDGGTVLPDTGQPPSCGNGTCGPGEGCYNCPQDCGVCPGCGDGKCDGQETCSNCPEDCGVCQGCGDGKCDPGENCMNCAPDCGVCPTCGDGKCQMPMEDCFNCPEDCGKCPGCGDGMCTPPKTCASCMQDCGVCAVCGNGKCEMPYETCINCPQDCGMCMTIGCFQMLTCSFGCVMGGFGRDAGGIPNVSLTCVADCLARGCPSAQFFFDQAFNCFLQNFQKCGGPNLGCLMQVCGPEISACIGYTCP